MAEFATYFSPGPPTIMVCMPQDRAELDALNAILSEDKRLVPTVEHSGSTCEQCQRPVWIGPTQLAKTKSPFFSTLTLCVQCVLTRAENTPGVEYDLIALDPEAQNRPRY